jgi:F0F1-type ATP synthase assembly protein I
VKLLPRQAPVIRTDDNIGRGMDFALCTLLFLGVGWLLDRMLGTRPILMIVLVVLALIGQFARIWVDYERKMMKLEAERTAARDGKSS